MSYSYRQIENCARLISNFPTVKLASLNTKFTKDANLQRISLQFPSLSTLIL